MQSPVADAWSLWALSADSPEKLRSAVGALGEHLKANPSLTASQVARALALQQHDRPHRCFAVCCDTATGVAAIQSPDSRRSLASQVNDRPPRIVFLLPGVGDHYAGMGRELYASQPVFRQSVDQCADLVEPHLKLDLRQLLYPPPRTDNPAASPKAALDFRRMVRGAPKGETQAGDLHRARLAQVLVFAVDYAVARLWLSWGLRPAAMLGYSLGEYVAACLSGVLSLKDALALVCKRGELIESLPPGVMLAVAAGPKDIEALLPAEVSLGAINGPSQCIVSGPAPHIERLERRLAASGIVHRRVQSSHAMHGHAMQPIGPALTQFAHTIQRQPPSIPYVSNVTGDWISDDDASDAAYWARHLCQTVRFAQGLEKLGQWGGAVLLEVGPGAALSSLALQHPAIGRGTCHVVSSMRAAYETDSDVARLLVAAGKLWLAGACLDWQAVTDSPKPDGVQLPAAVTDPAEGKPEITVFAERTNDNAHAPASDCERLLAEIWREVLKVDRLNPNDNFFALGGNSLQGVMVIARLKQQLGIEIPLKMLFVAPTLSQFAEAVMRNLIDSIDSREDESSASS